MAPPATEPQTELKANYAGPSTTQAFQHTLPARYSQSTEEKTEYLSTLRISMVKLQAEVNEFLTARMEEDKASAAGDVHTVDDKNEEENYGEEVVDEA